MSERWMSQFVLSRDERELGRQSELARRVRHAELAPVTRGAYRLASAIATEPLRADDDRYLALLRALTLLADGAMVFSGLSAAAAWGLPVIGTWPDRAFTRVQRAPGGRSNTTVGRSYRGGSAVAARGGLSVTPLAETVVEVGCSAPFEVAVAMADSALHGAPGRKPVPLHELWDELRRRGTSAGVAKCRAVIAFADGAAESAGESLSRVAIRRLHLPAPELQVPFHDDRGLIGIVDFWWPHEGLIGEFDGYGKYLRAEYTGDRTTAEVVIDEKLREDRLRAVAEGVARWGWSDARDLQRLAEKLRRLR